ncbi:hypothetical protein CTEN210_06435 [Chaetoceros tenuissimus]|uniref:Uncharacterized protein n=1 Tax=Chaetoceros tenuissimus TaxID=426638 RepID=A0AAD3CQH1_9STRA|nr:hypothetical protein CTEN210_06435 [Chaetoceros tenuissimus]
MNVFNFEDDEGINGVEDDTLEEFYNKANDIKDISPDAAMEQFEFLMGMLEQADAASSTWIMKLQTLKTLKLNSFKHLVKLKIEHNDYLAAATIYKQLLRCATSCVSLGKFVSDDAFIDSAFSLIEEILHHIFLVMPFLQDDTIETDMLLDLAQFVHTETVQIFNPFEQGAANCQNKTLWYKAITKYSLFLRRLKDEESLEGLVQELSTYFGNKSKDYLSHFVAENEMTPHVLFNIVEMQLSILRNDTTSFLHIYEEKKIELGCILSESMYDMGSIHQHAAELYMTSSTYDKACSSLIEACKCWKKTNDSHAHVHCVKILYIVKMLLGSASILGEDILGDVSPSESLPAIAKVFEAFRSNNIEVFEKYMNEVDKDCVVIKEGIVKIHRKLQKRILLKELPETSRVQFSDLSGELNDLALTSVTSLVWELIAEKKLRGQVINDEYLGSSVVEMQKKLLLKELPEMSRVKLSNLSSKLNGLGLPSVTSWVMSLICEKKLQGRLTFEEYIGSQFVPEYINSWGDQHRGLNNEISPSYVADSNHILFHSQSIGEKIEVVASINGSPTVYSLEYCQWPGHDVTSNCKASLLAHSIADIIYEARTKYPSFARHIDITSFDFDELGKLLINLVEKQREFSSRGIPSSIDIGHHYTKPACAASI